MDTLTVGNAADLSSAYASYRTSDALRFLADLALQSYVVTYKMIPLALEDVISCHLEEQLKSQLDQVSFGCCTLCFIISKYKERTTCFRPDLNDVAVIF